MKATLRLRRDELAKHRERASLRTDSDLATAMGANRVTVSKALNGRAKPSGDFLASLLTALGPGVEFADLFEIVQQEQIDAQALANDLEMLPRLAPHHLAAELDLVEWRVKRGRATPQDTTYLAALREEITHRQTTPTP